MKNVKIIEQGVGWYRDSTGKVTYTDECVKWYFQDWQCCEPGDRSRHMEETFKKLSNRKDLKWD